MRLRRIGVPGIWVHLASIQHPRDTGSVGGNTCARVYGLFMTKTLKAILLASGLLGSFQAVADELLVYTFFEARPFKGLTVQLNDRTLGVTNDQGNVRSKLDEGRYTLRVLKGDAVLAETQLIIADDESAEVSVAFADFQSDPKISVATFDEDGPATALKGSIRGLVTDFGGTPIAGADVMPLSGSPVTTTGVDGRFSLELPRGVYNLQVQHPDFQTAGGDAIRVVANVGVAANIRLRKNEAFSNGELSADDFADVEEVEVVGTFNPAEDAADLEKFSVAITDSISIEDLLRFGDSDVAAALKRIVGVSVTGGKYANIRGLDGRYISSTLNGSLMPSTDPFRRDVQLDLFPSSILGGIEIQKSYTANLPGDTTGGIIAMTTRDIPDEDVFGVSFNTGITTGVTGKSLLTYETSNTDVLGFDDGLRELPPSIRGNLENGNFRFQICQFQGQPNCISEEEAARIAGDLPVIYATQRETATPNFGGSIKFGRRREMETGELGYYASGSYGQSYGSRQDYTFDDLDQVGSSVWDSFQVNTSAYLVAGWVSDFGWDITSKSVFLRTADDRATINTGFNKDEDFNEESTFLEWIERQFIGQQFDGSISLFGNHTLSAQVGFTQTSRYSPDRREYQYRDGALAVSTVERSYSDLTEDGLDFGLDYQWPVQLTDWWYSNFRFGLLLNARDRTNELVRLGFRLRDADEVDLTDPIEELLTPQNFDDDVFQLNAGKTTDTDTYTATQDTTAFYMSSESDIGYDLTVVGGVRVENFALDLDYPNNPRRQTSENSDRDETNVLPTVSVTYRYTDDIQIRSGFSQTVSRPNLTELADSRFFDQLGREFIGCPTCVNSEITNLDLRGEYYFGNKDSVSLAVFYKQITDPLERAISDGSGSAVFALTFRNSQEATVQGIEFDASKRVIDGIDHVVDLSGNIALIESEITLDADGQRLEGITSRELQGQSPFLANFQVAYDNFAWDATMTFVANYFDDRIDAVSRAPAAPIVESGRLDINITAEKTFRDGSSLSFKVRNLLNQPIERTQAGRVVETWDNGIDISLGYSMDF